MTILLILITAAYFVLIGYFVIGFLKLKSFKSEDTLNKNCFSIIIPFRNEALNLPNLLDSIAKLNYSKEQFEVLLINDASEDDYLPIIDNFELAHPTIQLKVIQNNRKSNSPKKDAIDVGISHSSYDWVLTTDADCLVPKNWIISYNSFIETNNSNFIAGPVTIKESNNWFGKFQSIDFIALIGCTIGAFGIKKPFMCNGANICYKKETFKKVNGFEGNDKIASGDDVFLLEKMIQYDSKKVHFLKSIDALVQTNHQTTLKDLINQRVRWASKTGAYTSLFSKLVALIVLLMNLVFVFLLFTSIVNLDINLLFISVLTSKIIIDSIIIRVTSNFFKTNYNFTQYAVIIWLQPLFTFYIAVLSIFKKKYLWKNRSIK